MNDTKHDLREILRKTREEKTGISLKDIAEIIHESFKEHELRAITNNLYENY